MKLRPNKINILFPVTCWGKRGLFARSVGLHTGNNILFLFGLMKNKTVKQLNSME